MASNQEILSAVFKNDGKKGKSDTAYSNLYAKLGKAPTKKEFIQATGLSSSSYYRAKKKYSAVGVSSVSPTANNSDAVYAQLYLELHRTPTREEFKKASGMSDRSYFRAQKKFRNGLKDKVDASKANFVAKDIVENFKSYNSKFQGANAKFFGDFLQSYQKLRSFLNMGMSLEDLALSFARHTSGSSDTNSGYGMFLSSFRDMVDAMQEEIDALMKDRNADKYEIDRLKKLLEDAVSAWDAFTGFKQRQKKLKAIRKRMGFKT